MSNELPLNDHRRLGQNLDLFHIEEGAPGFIYWHPKGWALYQIIESFIRQKMKYAGYKEVKSPLLLPQSHWERSGHWEKFQDNMYCVPNEDENLALKPMSCPGHVAIYNASPKSWRDLPQRYCEFGHCHRKEPSGSLLGLMRSRSFEQDDAHVLCEENQVEEEISKFVSLLKNIYAAFGFEDIDVALSLRPKVRAGSDEDWDWSEDSLMKSARNNGLNPRLLPGEGAFYGPKLEFALKDKSGRLWQCGTVQLDCVLPKRLGASYVGKDGNEAIPIMIHHAVLGSLGRFIGILLEHYDGDLPYWLAPSQIAVLPISEHQFDEARRFKERLEENGIRAEVYGQNETLSRRIVMVKDQKIPIMAIIGKKEVESCSVAIKEGENQLILHQDEALNYLLKR